MPALRSVAAFHNSFREVSYCVLNMSSHWDVAHSAARRVRPSFDQRAARGAGIVPTDILAQAVAHAKASAAAAAAAPAAAATATAAGRGEAVPVNVAQALANAKATAARLGALTSAKRNAEAAAAASQEQANNVSQYPSLHPTLTSHPKARRLSSHA